MIDQCRAGRTNPFSTGQMRRRGIPPLDADGCPRDVDALMARLSAAGGSAAIVGPHGSGKSTLLRTMAAHLEVGGVRVVRVAGRTDVVAIVRGVLACGGGTLCVDGWERIGWLGERAVWGLARLCGTRLLVTAHGRGALPTLLTCTTSPRLLGAIVARLLHGSDARAWLEPQDVAEVFERSRGNIREALFQLYDRCEARSGGRPSPGASNRSVVWS